MPELCRVDGNYWLWENEVSWGPGLGVPLSNWAGGQVAWLRPIPTSLKISIPLSWIFCTLVSFFFLKNTLKYVSWLLFLLGFPQSLYPVCPHYPYPDPSLSYLISYLSVSYPFPVEVGLVLEKKVEMITAQIGRGWGEPRAKLKKVPQAWVPGLGSLQPSFLTFT